MVKQEVVHRNLSSKPYRQTQDMQIRCPFNDSHFCNLHSLATHRLKCQKNPNNCRAFQFVGCSQNSQINYTLYKDVLPFGKFTSQMINLQQYQKKENINVNESNYFSEDIIITSKIKEEEFLMDMDVIQEKLFYFILYFMQESELKIQNEKYETDQIKYYQMKIFFQNEYLQYYKFLEIKQNCVEMNYQCMHCADLSLKFWDQIFHYAKCKKRIQFQNTINKKQDNLKYSNNNKQINNKSNDCNSIDENVQNTYKQSSISQQFRIQKQFTNQNQTSNKSIDDNMNDSDLFVQKFERIKKLDIKYNNDHQNAIILQIDDESTIFINNKKIKIIVSFFKNIIDLIQFEMLLNNKNLFLNYLNKYTLIKLIIDEKIIEENQIGYIKMKEKYDQDLILLNNESHNYLKHEIMNNEQWIIQQQKNSSIINEQLKYEYTQIDINKLDILKTQVKSFPNQFEKLNKQKYKSQFEGFIINSIQNEIKNNLNFQQNNLNANSTNINEERLIAPTISTEQFNTQIDQDKNTNKCGEMTFYSIW